MDDYNIFQLTVDKRNIDWNKIIIPSNVLYNKNRYNVGKYILILDQYYIDITNYKKGDHFRIITNGTYIGTIVITENNILWKGEEITDAVLMTINKKSYKVLRDAYEVRKAA